MSTLPENVKVDIRVVNDPKVSDKEREEAAARLRARAASDADARSGRETRLLGSVEYR